MSIASELSRIQSAKNTLKTKLNGKNDSEHQITNETIDEYGDYVDSIQGGIDTSDATATAANILATKTAYVNGNKITGIMPNNGALSYTPGDNAISIPAGYTSGGTVSAVDITTLEDYQTCDAIASNILQTVLPYIPLEYIQSTRTQYIDTGLTFNGVSQYSIELELTPTRFYDHNAILCIGTGTEIEAWIDSGGNFYYRYNGVKPSATKLTVNTKIKIKLLYTNSRVYIYVDDVLKTSYSALITANANSLWLLHRVDYAEVKLYSCKIEQNNVIVRNFIPVKRKSDNEVCLYDLTTNSFYTNAGSGDFTAGPEIEEV